MRGWVSAGKLGHVLFTVRIPQFLVRSYASSELLFISVVLDLLKAAHQCFIYTHYRAIVVELSAVVGGRKDCHELSASKKLVAILLDLVASCYKIDIELLGEVGHYIFIEYVAYSAFTFRPVLVHAFFWICPEHVAQQALVWDVCRALYHLNVTVVIQLLAQASMHAKDFVVDQRCYWQLFEHAYKPLKQPAILLICRIDLQL